MPAAIRPGDPEQVRDLFDRIAPSYDRLNDTLSLGLHRLWKRQAIAWLAPEPGQRLLDLCCGTGDLALAMKQPFKTVLIVLLHAVNFDESMETQTFQEQSLSLGSLEGIAPFSPSRR